MGLLGFAWENYNRSSISFYTSYVTITRKGNSVNLHAHAARPFKKKLVV